MVRQSPAFRRRRFLAGVGTATIVSTAGCASVANWIGDRVLGDVNLFSNVDERLSGAIEIEGPDGETVLEETFDVSAAEEDDGDDVEEDVDEGGAMYDDVWTDAGTYEVSVTLDDGLEVEGQSEANTSVSIDDPDEVMLAVVFGADEFDDGIAFTTGESLTDLFEESPSRSVG